MRYAMAAVSMAVLLLAACSRVEEERDRQARRDTTPAMPGHDMAAMGDSAASEMAGMDHGAVGGMAGMDHPGMAQAAGQPGGGMAGMAHPGMEQPDAQAGGRMAGMDHARMEQMARQPSGAMPRMDHPAMPPGQPAGGAVDVDHANMPGMAPSGAPRAAMPAMGRAPETPAAVLERMLADPVIRERIATDPLLHVLVEAVAPPTAGIAPMADAIDHAGMAGMDHGAMGAMDHGAMPGMAPAAGVDATADEKLRALAAVLLRDPAIRMRVQTDPELRTLWSDASVRRFLGAAPE